MYVSAGRALFGALVMLSWTAACMLAVVLSGSLAVAVVAGALYTVPLISLWEWLTHGVLYHRVLPGMKKVRKIHVGGHHLSLFPPKQYVRQGRYSFMRFRAPLTPWQMSDNLLDSFLTSGSQVALHFVIGVPSILGPAWLFTGSVAFLASCTISLAVISVLLAYVHGVIHNPKGRLVERMGWFMWLDRHHYIHHVDMTANMNFLLPLCDVLFGTRKPALTPDEVAANPSFEQAKPMAWDVGQAAK